VTTAEIQAITEWMHDQGVAAFRIGDLAVTFGIVKRPQVVDTLSTGPGATRPGLSSTNPAKMFEGMDLDVLLGVSSGERFDPR
jgi:hypothetical protein